MNSHAKLIACTDTKMQWINTVRFMAETVARLIR